MGSYKEIILKLLKFIFKLDSSHKMHREEFAQALRSVGEPIFGQSIKDISGGNLLSQLFEITEKFNMPTHSFINLTKNNGSSRRSGQKTLS